MNALLKKESTFLKLLLVTTSQQQKALIETITPSQMKAIVQIVYNVLQGNRHLPENIKSRLQKDKLFIRRFISRQLRRKERRKLLLNHLLSILLIIGIIKSEL